MLKSSMPRSIETGIYFVNISKDRSSILSYKTEFSPKHHFFDIKLIGQGKVVKVKDHFFHIHKGDSKIVYKKTAHNLIFSVGADVVMQFQVLEALIDHLIEEFDSNYGSYLTDFGSGSQQNFQDFIKKINHAIKHFHDLDLVSYVQIFCTYCKCNHIVAVKNSLIKNSEKSIVPIVYNHNGIPLLLYIDQDFGIRGIEHVSITG